MRVLYVLTYYRPHVSGLTIYVERLAREMARRGHASTVLTSQYARELPRDETLDGVRVVRAPVLMRVSKGVVMPTFSLLASRLVREHDVVSLHLPQFDAAGVALRSRLMGRPTTLTYHCDLRLPPGALSRAANLAVNVMNDAAARLAHAIVAYTDDFAAHSPLLSRYRHKVCIIPPPVEVSDPSPQEVAAFAERHGLNAGPGRTPVIGFVARLATEKGVEVLLRALPRVLAVHPQARVLFAGQHENVLGEEAYARRLEPLLQRHAANWTFLGILNASDLAALYRCCDLVVLPSLNSTESFGLVQVEAMLCGAPSIASDLPGVRQPVWQTGMGRVVPVGDAETLAEAILAVLATPEAYRRPRAEIASRFGTGRTADGYEALFAELAASRGR